MTLVVGGSNPSFYPLKRKYKLHLQRRKTIFDKHLSFNLNKRLPLPVFYSYKLTTIDESLLQMLFNSSRTIRFFLTILIKNQINLWLTFRKNLPKRKKVMSMESRWLLQTFFFFKYLYELSTLKTFIVLFKFLKLNSFFFSNMKPMLINFNFFFKKNQINFLVLFCNNFYSHNWRIQKRVKSIKKFRQKIFNKSNKILLNFLNFNKN